MDRLPRVAEDLLILLLNTKSKQADLGSVKYFTWPNQKFDLYYFDNYHIPFELSYDQKGNIEAEKLNLLVNQEIKDAMWLLKQKKYITRSLWNINSTPLAAQYQQQYLKEIDLQERILFFDELLFEFIYRVTGGPLEKYLTISENRIRLVARAILEKKDFYYLDKISGMTAILNTNYVLN